MGSIYRRVVAQKVVATNHKISTTYSQKWPQVRAEYSLTPHLTSAGNWYPDTGTRFITRYPDTRSLPGYPNTDQVFLLPVCCPLHSALMAANLVQSATYLTNLMQIYMQLQIWLYIFSTSSLHLILLYQHRQLQ